MAAKVSFFPVGCGDMTLVKTDNNNYVLIDINIRKAADDAGDDTPDVATQLKDRLPKDDQGRRYVDAMMLSHPDRDHILGLETHFHLGPIADYPKDSGKIIIREMWSSPIVFRRASKDHTLCADAKAWACEARRRVARFRELGFCPDQERILILGEDVDGKTDDLTDILVKIDETWSAIDGEEDGAFSALLLAPMPPSDDEEEEETLTKNNSSVIARFVLASGTTADACRFLTGGDAEVAIWERVWDRNAENADEHLAYDLLLAPHHCSWHSLSCDSWSEKGEDAEVNEDARQALGQAREGAKIIASSKTIEDDDKDPPCIRAKREYEDIVDGVDGVFVCVADNGAEPLEYDIKAGGLDVVSKAARASILSTSIIGRQPVPHGSSNRG